MSSLVTRTIATDGLAARMSAQYWGLNAEQTAAFEDDGNCVVIACPGSGKTRLVIAKATKYVLRYGPKKVMLVTFSRPAADEMRSRMAKAIGSAIADQVRIGTYHGLSHDLLRKHYASKGKKYRVVRDSQARRMILDERDHLAPNITNEDALAGVARIKATIRTDEELEGMTDPISLIYLAYQEKLRDYGGKDFADLIREANQLFATGEMEPFKARYLLADEKQDTDRSQYDWLLAHCRGGATLTSVGDDDQSIYGFRNAMGHLALRGLAQDTNASLYFLNTNYRCGRKIVYLADSVIRDNLGRIEKEFQVGSEIEGEVAVTAYRDSQVEAEGVIEQFVELISDPNFKPVENMFAVMHRTNFGLDYFDIASVGCPYRVVREGGSTFIDRPHVSQALSILRLALNSEDRLSWHDAVYLAGMTTEGVRHFDTYIRKLPASSSMVDAVYSKEWLDRLGKQDKTLFEAFRGVTMRWIDEAGEFGEGPAGDEMCGPAVQKICSRIADLTSNQYHRKDIAFLGKIIATRIRGSLGTRLHAVSKKRSEDADAGGVETPVLKLMTLHGSKGLQFDAVFLVGLNEGSLPLDNSDIEEERRLFYVGITRAISRLYISYIKSGEQPVSRFLANILRNPSPA